MQPTAEDLDRELSLLPRVRVLDVEYVHVPLERGDDLYLTRQGLPCAGNLLPGSFWTDKEWFRSHAERLSGSSTLYRIRTKPVAGRSKEIVLKWNRMGQDVPGATEGRDLSGAEFNSPFEEFSLTIELRDGEGGSGRRILTHKPLAIYVPREHVDLDRLGRKRYKIEAKRDAHKGVELDAFRKYAVIYEWVKGIDAAQAFREGLVGREELSTLVDRAAREMRARGFVVRDNKAQHVIVRPVDGNGLARNRRGRLLYAAVDFELLERTPKHERAVRAAKRRTYLVKQVRRFEAEADFPPHLHPVRIFGVDYVFGHTESTNGALWVVGRDAELFDYFLPERWRTTPRTKLSLANLVYETITKDNIHLVWRVSKVGEQPEMDPFKPDEQQILDYGYNSPFEEVALAMELSRRGVPTIYPRAIYMTGDKSGLTEGLADNRRYQTHQGLRRPDGKRILRKRHDYIIIWGYWNGPDEMLAAKDEDVCRGINALDACRAGLVDQETYLQMMEATRRRLEKAGIEDLNLRGNHLLLSVDRAGRLLREPDGMPTVRICNFELLRQTDKRGRPGSPA
jgi:hypothetical protein